MNRYPRKKEQTMKSEPLRTQDSDLPPATVAGKTRVPRLMHSGRAVLLDLADRTALRDAAAGWSDQVDVVVARCEQQSAPADAFLIRPDGYVAWVASAQDADDEAERQLRRALATWFGPKDDLVCAPISTRGGL
jgi:hypothetical protein